MLDGININNTNYSHYGTSVYAQLYHNQDVSNAVSTSSAGGVRGSGTGAPAAAVAAAGAPNTRLKQKYRSLIHTSSKKIKHRAADHISLFSFKSSSKPVVRPPPTLMNMPTEVLELIVSYIPDSEASAHTNQLDLLHCTQINRKFHSIAKKFLYREPVFHSTYRLAQFVTSIRLHPSNALYVHSLDLSVLKNGTVQNDLAWATWRDWRYRNDPVYNNSSISNSLHLKKINSSTSMSSANSFARSRSSSISVQSTLSSESIVKQQQQQQQQQQEQQGQPPKQESKWDKLIRRRRRNKTYVLKPTSIPSFDTTTSQTIASNTTHPYTNKFLLRYASYKDIPMGYLLHILKLCTNMKNLDLSNIQLYQDFHVLSNKAIFPNTLPALKESTIWDEKDQQLDVCYLTDSHREYDFYQNDPSSSRRHSLSSNHSLLSEPKNKPALTKVQPMEFIDLILSKLSRLQNFKITNCIWLRESMVKNLILTKFVNTPESDFRCNFNKSGLDRNMLWTTQGTLSDLVGLIVMEEVINLDDLDIEKFFSIKSERYQPVLSRLDADIIEVSRIIPLKYDESNTIFIRLTILKNDDSFSSFQIKKITETNYSMVIMLSDTQPSSEEWKALYKPYRKVDKAARSLIQRIRELKSDDLRLNMGENNYTMDALLL